MVGKTHVHVHTMSWLALFMRYSRNFVKILITGLQRCVATTLRAPRRAGGYYEGRKYTCTVHLVDDAFECSPADGYSSSGWGY